MIGLEQWSDAELAVLQVLDVRRDLATPTAVARNASVALTPAHVRRVLTRLQEQGLVAQRLDETWRIRRRGHTLLRGERIALEARSGFSPLSDRTIQKAVSSLQRRSERQTDEERLAVTFVDPGITDQLDNDNNQIIYGRRGTGKTHALRVLARVLNQRAGQTSLYLDLRVLGSSSIYDDTTREMSVRVASLLKDVLEEVHGRLLDHATAPDAEVSETVIDDLDALGRAITRSTLAGETVRREHEMSSGSEHRGQVGVSLGIRPSLDAGGYTGGTAAARAAEFREGSPLAYVLFGEVADALRRALRATRTVRFYLLLDEWTAIPLELQPLFAEFLKRTFFTLPEATVKIASLEYRSDFATPVGRNNVIGFELGADTTSLELDDYFVYDRVPRQTERTFAELLYRHLGTEAELESTSRSYVGPSWRGSLRDLKESLRMALPDEHLRFEYLERSHAIDGGDTLVDGFFATRNAFRELVRAGEGVVRDFMNIFSSSYFQAVRRGDATITVEAVRAAAQKWFETDKAPNLTDPQARLLEYLSREMLGKRRARTFFLQKRHERHDLIRSLFDFRLIHLVYRGYADPAIGGRFNIYALDYGFYVQLLGTQRAPASDISSGSRRAEDVVRVGDRRWVRRVTLNDEELERATMGAARRT